MVCKILIAFLYIIAKLLNIFQKILVTHNILLWFSFFRYIWSIEYIKIYSKHVSSAYSTISKWNIKESLLGTFCIFSYRHETFNAVYVFLTIGKVRFWLVSGQRIVDLQNAQCILDFFWKHLIFIIYWVKVFEKTLQNFIEVFVRSSQPMMPYSFIETETISMRTKCIWCHIICWIFKSLRHSVDLPKQQYRVFMTYSLIHIMMMFYLISVNLQVFKMNFEM